MAEKPELDILNPLPFNAAKKGKKESRILDATDLFIVLVSRNSGSCPRPEFRVKSNVLEYSTLAVF